MTTETAFSTPCEGDWLVGVLHRPDSPAQTAVVIVVGGPQYRVGSHRQFLLLARQLAASGFPVLRFDCRGMGDSSGRFPGFERIDADISAACRLLLDELPTTRRLVLWGLCDGASAALMHAKTGLPVAGLVLVNPWVRSETTLAKTYLRHYYVQRFFSRDFWRKLLGGGLNPARALGELGDNLRASAARSDSPEAEDSRDFITRMRDGLQRFRGRVLLVLSGNDYTAAEFVDLAATPSWSALLERPDVSSHRIEAADHTFSSAAWRDALAQLTAGWLTELDAAAARQP